MTPKTVLFPLFSLLLVFGGLISCSSLAPQQEAEQLYTPEQAEKMDKSAPNYVNPFKPGSYLHFLARQDYPKTYDSWKDDQLVSKATGKNSKLVIELATQRGKWLVNNQMALNFPISTGIKSYPTKPGNYTIIARSADHKSNLYGVMYDAEGKVTEYNADTTEHTVPEGGRFEGSAMPYFMRLTNAGLGLHVGKVRRSPCSHGCIRVPREICQQIFEKTSVGTPVTIK